MIIAVSEIGDMCVTVHRVQTLRPTGNPADDFTYEVRFTDLPTDRTRMMVAEGEDHAIRLFCAWLMADEPNGLDNELEQLRNFFGNESRTFLP